MAENSVDIPVTGSAKEALVFANTPSFLMRRLQSDLMVQYATQFCSEDMLLATLAKWSTAKAETPENLLQPYVSLIALSLIGSNDAWSKAKMISFDNLPWERELLALADVTRNETYISFSSNPVQAGIGEATLTSWSAVEAESFSGVGTWK